MGGYDGQTRLTSAECYDSFSNRWTEVASMKEAVSSPAVASCAGKLFVIGGGPDDNTCSDKVGDGNRYAHASTMTGFTQPLITSGTLNANTKASGKCART